MNSKSKAGIISGIKRSQEYKNLETDEEKKEYLENRLREIEEQNEQKEQDLTDVNLCSTPVQQNLTDLTDVNSVNLCLTKEEQKEQDTIVSEQKLTDKDKDKDKEYDNDKDNNTPTPKSKKINSMDLFLTFIKDENPEVERQWKEVMNYWMDYKREIKKPFKSQKSIENCYLNLRNELSNNDVLKAKELVNYAIGKCWEGIFPKRDYTTIKNVTPQESMAEKLRRELVENRNRQAAVYDNQ